MQSTISTPILLLYLLVSLNVFGQDAPSKAPEQIFTLAPDNLGQASNSVNLFTGEVNFPVTLASIPGRNGLSASVSISYNSAGVAKQAAIWNNDAPTGIVGLGWSMDQPKIVVDNKSTGTKHDDEYYLLSGGSSNKMVWISEDATGKEYALDNFQFWKIRYYNSDDRWEILDENGIKYTYGSNSSGKNTIQWVVKWGNWIGSSSVTSNQAQQAMAYNLWKVENRLGDAIEYEYNNTDQYVGSSLGEKHTEASYLSKITTSTGEEIILNYVSKGSDEFVEPHTEQNEPDAYQERYEKLFLNSVDAYNYQGVKLSTTSIAYDIIGSGDLTKRLISEVNFTDINGSTTNGYSFQYNTSATLKGKLSTVETSNGGIISYSYASAAVQPAKSARDLTINAPSGYAEPEIHYGPDYVLVTWRQINSDGSHFDGNKSVAVYVYTWEGYWKEQQLPSIYNVQLENGFRKGYATVTGKDFFAISRWNPNSSHGYNVYIFSKDKTTGEWKAAKTGGYYELIEQSWIPTLLAGDNYVALHSYNDGDIVTYVRNGNSWDRKEIEYSDQSIYSRYWHSTGTNNWIFSHQKNGSDFLRFHYLKEDRNWTSVPVVAPFNADYDDHSFWYASNSFAVAMADDNAEYIFSWDEDYTSFSPYNVLGALDDRSRVLIQNNSLISLIDVNQHVDFSDLSKVYFYNQSKGARFNGNSFIPYNNIIGWGTGGVSVGSDYIMYQGDSRNNPGSTITSHLKSYDPNTNQWVNSLTSSYDENNGYFLFDSEDFLDHGYPVESGFNSLILLNNFYKRKPNGIHLYNGSITTPSTEKIRNSSVAHSSDFIIYSTTDNNKVPLGYKIHLIKNGNLMDPIAGNGFPFSTYSNKNYHVQWNKELKLVAGSTYITTDKWNGFENATTLTLHRVINENVAGLQSHYPVVKVSTNDGVNIRHTSFEYEPYSARMDPSGLTAQYKEVNVVPGHDVENKHFGYNKTYFYNLPSVASKGNYLIGSPYASYTYGKNMGKVAENSTSFNLLQKDLSGTIFYYVRPYEQITTVDDVSTSVIYSYDQASGLMKSSSSTNYNSHGVEEVLKKEIKYAFEEYPELATENVLTPIVQQKTLSGSTVTSSSATKWVLQLGKLMPYATYTWKGSGSADFSSWNSQPSASDWLKTSEITSRDSYFNVVESKDMDGFHNTTVYGHNGRVVIGSFFNAEEHQVLMEDFNDGDYTDSEPTAWSPASGWSIINNMLRGYKGSGTSSFNNSFIGMNGDFIAEFRAKLEPLSQSPANDDGIGFHFGKTNLNDAPSVSGILFNINPYTGNYTLSSPADGEVANSPVTDQYDWHNYRIVRNGQTIKIYVDGQRIFDEALTQNIGFTFGFFINRAKGYIDDVRIYPDDASAVTTSYDPQYLIPESHVNEDGHYVKALLDETTPVASINSKGQVASTVMGYSPKHDGSTVSSSNLLLNHQTTPTGMNGFVEDFDFGDKWNTIDSDNGSSPIWIVDEGKLFHQSPGSSNSYAPDMFHITLPESIEGKVGLEFSLRALAFPNNNGFGLVMGGNEYGFLNGGNEVAAWMSIQYDDLKIYNSSGWLSLKNNLKKNSTYRIKIVIDLNNQSADYFVDGKLLLQNVAYRSPANDISKVAFFNYGLGSATSSFFIDNLVVYSDPVQSTVFFDAEGKERQNIIQEDKNNVIITESLYDVVGRKTLETKPTRVAGGLKFKESFITGYDESTGAIDGDVNSSNSDPYASVRQKYESSPLSRVIESGAPGSDYLLGGGNNPIVEYLSNVSSPVKMGEAFTGSNYKVTRNINPNGAESYTYTDKTGKLIMQKSGTVSGKEMKPVYSTTTVQEDNSFTFTPDITHTVSYNYSDVSGTSTTLKIGTSSGSSDIVYSFVSKSGTFTAIKGQTYYVEVTYTATDPQPVYYDYDCYTVIPFNSIYCFDSNNCRIECPDEPCDPGEPCNPKLESNSMSGLRMPVSNVILDYSTTSQLMDSDIYLTTSYQYDKFGNTVKIFPPNYHNPPNETVDPNSYVTTSTYDFFGRIKSTTSPDNGTTKYIYESKTGRLRFMQDAQGAVDGNILYTKYDSYGRVVETGYFASGWIEQNLQNYADTDPDYPLTQNVWRKKHFYGLHGEYTSNKDNLRKVEINNDSDVNPEVIELYTYDRYGQLSTKELQITDNINGISTTYSHTISYRYDNTGNVIEEDYGEGPGKVLFHYDEMGRLKSIGNLSDPDAYAYYEYNVNGALSKEITNNSAVEKSFSYDKTGRLIQIQDPFFNEVVNYEVNSSLISSAFFDYKSSTSFAGSVDNYSYNFTYDQVGQLKAAQNSLNANWSIGSNTPTKYDANGNIITLEKGSASKTYTYDNGTNKINRTSGSTRQYHYDANGNIIQSVPLNITFDYDTYFNKAISATHATGSSNFLYRGDGERVYKRVTEGTDWNETFYIRGASDYPLIEKYKDSNNNEETKYYIYGANGLIAMMHSFNAVMTSSATMENQTLATEKQNFQIDDGYGNRINAELFNHTSGDSARYSLRLSGKPGEQKGLSFIHKVRKGDTVRMEVYAKYIKDIQNPDADAVLLSLASMATGNITPGAGETGGSSLAKTEPGGAFGSPGSNGKNKKPEAYLNYIIYDTLFNLLDAGYIPVTDAAAEDGSDTEHEKLYMEKISGYDGYMQAFVSNENPESTDVYFDDMTMSLSSTDQLYFLSTDHLGSVRAMVRDDGAVMMRYDYDPMGEVIRSEGSESISYQYTGQERDTELSLWNFRARFYDAELGIFYGVDPQKYLMPYNSPYVGMMNNPIMYLDPDGELPFLAIVAIGAVIFGTTNVAVQAGNGEIDNFWDGAKAFSSGALAGAAITAGITVGLGVPVLGTMIKGAGIAYGGTLAVGTVNGIGHGIIGGDWSKMSNTWKLFAGNFYLDGNRNFFGQTLQGIGRFSWELPQSTIGHGYSQIRNTMGGTDRVDYFGGATFSTAENQESRNGVSIGNFININLRDQINGKFEDRVINDPLFMHEYGHTFDSQIFGAFYIPVIGLPSLMSAASSRHIGGGLSSHDMRWYERNANKHAARYFGKHYGVDWSIYEPPKGGYPRKLF